jgi:hypothetical protein
VDHWWLWFRFEQGRGHKVHEETLAGLGLRRAPYTWLHATRGLAIPVLAAISQILFMPYLDHETDAIEFLVWTTVWMLAFHWVISLLFGLVTWNMARRRRRGAG